MSNKSSIPEIKVLGFGRLNQTGPIVRAKDNKGSLKRLWSYLGRRKASLSLVFLMVAISTVLNLIGPILIGTAIDKYIMLRRFDGLFSICFIMLVIYILGALSTWVQNYVMIGTAQNAIQEIRKDLFEKLQTLPLSYFDVTPHGDLMSRLTNDVDNISSTLNNSVTQIFSSLITFIGTLSMMLYLSPILTLVSMVTIPLMIFITKKISVYTRKIFVEQQKNLGDLNSFIEETISGQKVIKVFCREEVDIKEFENNNTKLTSAAIRAQIFSGIMGPVMNVLNNLSFALVAGAGGLLASKGVVTVGVIVIFINYSKQFSRPINDLANQFNAIQSAIAGAERVFEVMDKNSEPIDSEGCYSLKDITGVVKFQDVSFGYNIDTPVLKNLNLDVKAGQTIALVGPTGAGKTTIINLLTRFYDINKGLITIDDHNITKVSRNSLRSCLGIVLQDTYLFSESVRENIRYGRLAATNSEIEYAAKLANADHFISQLPQGYETILSEDGGSLSQGQRQLLSIARAILASPAVLILDEATSSVDTRTEQHIQQAMLTLMKGRTSFVIAHRLSTIKEADLILVINNGEVIEKGNHQELLELQGFYYNLNNSQFRRKIS